MAIATTIPVRVGGSAAIPSGRLALGICMSIARTIHCGALTRTVMHRVLARRLMPLRPLRRASLRTPNAPNFLGGASLSELHFATASLNLRHLEIGRAHV